MDTTKHSTLDNEIKVYSNCLTILETISMAKQEYLKLMGHSTSIFTILIDQLTEKQNQEVLLDNKLYSSEILSLLLLDSENQAKFGELGYIPYILEYLRYCQNIETFSSTDKEIIENMFTSVNTCLLSEKNKGAFLENEGVEIMMKLML